MYSYIFTEPRRLVVVERELLVGSVQLPNDNRRYGRHHTDAQEQRAVGYRGQPLEKEKHIKNDDERRH